jgi:hypothetical protein
MEYVLSCRGFIRLGYVNPITSKPFLDGFRNFVEFFYYLATCLVVQFINVLDVLFWNYQRVIMPRHECNYVVIFSNDKTGYLVVYYFAENTVIHNPIVSHERF